VGEGDGVGPVRPGAVIVVMDEQTKGMRNASPSFVRVQVQAIRLQAIGHGGVGFSTRGLDSEYGQGSATPNRSANACMSAMSPASGV